MTVHKGFAKRRPARKRVGPSRGNILDAKRAKASVGKITGSLKGKTAVTGIPMKIRPGGKPRVAAAAKRRPRRRTVLRNPTQRRRRFMAKL